MEYGAIDLHKNERQIRIVTEGGTVTDRRIATTRDRLTAMFWGRPRMRILVEASTESEWVAQHLERLGHEVVVADPNFSAMYGHRSRRIKTDRRDVAALAEACQHGVYRAVHRRSIAQRTVQAQLTLSASHEGWARERVSPRLSRRQASSFTSPVARWLTLLCAL